MDVMIQFYPNTRDTVQAELWVQGQTYIQWKFQYNEVYTCLENK